MYLNLTGASAVLLKPIKEKHNFWLKGKKKGLQPTCELQIVAKQVLTGLVKACAAAKQHLKMIF